MHITEKKSLLTQGEKRRNNGSLESMDRSYRPINNNNNNNNNNKIFMARIQ